FGLGDTSLQPHTQRMAIANDAHAHVILVQTGNLPIKRIEEKSHEARHLFLRTSPILARECKHGKRLDAEPPALLDRPAQGLNAGLVSGAARQAASGCPAAVSVHDDGNMPGKVHQTCMISFSLTASSWSISAMCLSVSFCTSVSARRSSSCEISFSFSSSLMS